MSVNDAWSKVKTCLLNGVDQFCGWTHRGRVQHAKTWWWNDDVDQYIKEKPRLWKMWKMSGSKEDYLVAKKCAKHSVYHAKKIAQETPFTEITLKRTTMKSSN